jgi:hypothetical protein
LFGEEGGIRMEFIGGTVLGGRSKIGAALRFGWGIQDSGMDLRKFDWDRGIYQEMKILFRIT